MFPDSATDANPAAALHREPAMRRLEKRRTGTGWCGALALLSLVAVNPVSTDGGMPILSTLAQTRSEAVLVRSVIDGDTIDVAAVGRVNLLGVAAPARGRGPAASARLAREAAERLSGLVLNRWVRLEYETPLSGRSSHRAAYVFLEDGRLVNEWLVAEGLARVAGEGLRRLAELKRAERDAQALHLGIWQSAPGIR
jgi:endonuclease YncB( thermonuclease family)